MVSMIDKFFLGYERDIYAVLIYTVGIVIYSIIVWNFYINLSKRDLIKFDLYKFDIDSPVKKVFDIFSYFLKYLIITPLLSSFWFIVMLFFLFILSKSQSIYSILIISITLIGATRISSYYNEKLSEDLAKAIPFTLLALFVIDPAIFSINIVLARFNEIQNFLPLILRFLVLIVLLEFILRMFHEIKELIRGD